ncbi:MAG: hypothetical protein ACI8W8_004747, partial [Rhodothermales bacterium]
MKLLLIALCLSMFPMATMSEPCRVQVTDAENGWPVPLVELRTTHDLRFVSDNAGLIAIDDPTLMHRETWFTIIGHGYGVAKDGFGYRGIRLTPTPGGTIELPLKRSSIAKRIGRITGHGLFAESAKLGDTVDWQGAGGFGRDSVQVARYRDTLYWIWGDTRVGHYPLGVFHMTGAISGFAPFDLKPPLRPQLEHLRTPQNRPLAVARMPGDGPTWLTGLVALPDATGKSHLVAVYRKIKPPLETVEGGFCEWNDAHMRFEPLRSLWRKSDGDKPIALADAHAALTTDADGKRWLYLGNPLPHARVPATYEAWQDLRQWQLLTPQRRVKSIDGNAIEPHSGSIAWNAYRKRWVSVFMQKFGKPSAFGTLWYAEADAPIGPWGPAIEILSHENYTFYNPRLHPEQT